MGELFSDALKPLDDHLKARLVSHAKLLQALDGKQPGVGDIEKLFEDGYLPTVAVTNDLEIGGSMSASSSRTSSLDGGGAVTFGPLQINVKLSSQKQVGETDNVTVKATLHIEELSQVYARAVAGLTGASA